MLNTFMQVLPVFIYKFIAKKFCEIHYLQNEKIYVVHPDKDIFFIVKKKREYEK